MNPRSTPLNAVHKEYGARMATFAGWQLPIQYRSALEEHRAVRNAVGIFDVSHMGELECRGPGAEALLQKVTCNNVSRLSDGQAQYSAFLTPGGTFIDDIIVYRFHSERFLLCVNAATTQKDLEWLQKHQLPDSQVSDLSSAYAQIAVQGPMSEIVLQKLTNADLSILRRFRFVQAHVLQTEALISRTGYTGEDGFEIYLAPDQAESIWRRLIEEGEEFGLEPAGLAARDTLRLEVCYPLYGNDIDEEHSPLEAGLQWIVKLEKGDFIGSEALRHQKEKGVERRLAGIELIDKGIVRRGHAVFLDERPVGRITSGGFSPTLEKSIGLMYLPTDEIYIGQRLDIEIRGRRRRAEIVETPFYHPQG